jgi:hypothetical protein
MGIKVRSRWRSLALMLGFALLVLTVPAQAASVTPTFVEGGSDCSTVGSAAPFSLSLTAPVRSGTYAGENGAQITVTLTNFRGTAFNFSIEGGLVYDVIVKGSGSNWYDYDGSEGGAVEGDTGLTIPNGNRLNVVHFCYSPGVPIECNEPVVVSEEGTTGTFTRTGGDCEESKTVVIDVVDDTIVFIPSGGSGGTTYLGTLTFTKGSLDENALVLLYDPDDDGPASFTEVPDCDEGPTLPEGTDTWCVISASASYLGGSVWEITWDVYGEGDPLFK